MVAEDVAGRGTAGLRPLARGGLLGAARSIAGHVEPRVVILTGFMVAHADPPLPETDGPVGAAHLAAGLLAAGVECSLLTDEPCAGAVVAALHAAGVAESRLRTVAASEDRARDTETLALRLATARDAPTHTIAIERVGPAHDGVPRNHRGRSIAHATAPLERIFELPGAVRIGVGDGGNELGMGKLGRTAVGRAVPRGFDVACRVACDHLVLAGVSNWGAIGLLGALACSLPERADALLARLTPEHDARILRAAVDDGPAVDGTLARRAYSVDGLGPEHHARVIREVVALARTALASG